MRFSKLSLAAIAALVVMVSAPLMHAQTTVATFSCPNTTLVPVPPIGGSASPVFQLTNYKITFNAALPSPAPEEGYAVTVQLPASAFSIFLPLAQSQQDLGTCNLLDQTSNTQYTFDLRTASASTLNTANQNTGTTQSWVEVTFFARNMSSQVLQTSGWSTIPNPN